MIITQLSGGLGNQLFQYAMGRVLAIENNTSLKIDLSFFEDYEWHEYSLNPLSIHKNIATKAEVESLKGFDRLFLNKIKRKLFKRNFPTVIKEVNLGYNLAYLQIKSPAYLIGYWQSEKYFFKYSDVIKKELKVATPPSMKNKYLLDDINSQESVSLHVRRGNYVQLSDVNKIHGTCTIEYYSQAIKSIITAYPNAFFYIFSDDIPWVKENLKIQHKHMFVDINDSSTDYEDFRLMYSCKHNITANSTFSWWSAWLNENPNKIVIAPRNWFADLHFNQYSDSIVPASWIRI